MREITVYFTTGYPTKQMQEELISHGYRLLFGSEKRIPSIDLSEVEVLVCYNPFSVLSLSDLPKLKWIHLVSKGINHVPADEVSERGILVTNTENSTSIPISEWIITQILCLYKQIPTFVCNQRQALYRQNHNILELTDKKILFLGTGYIAKEAAKRLLAFNTHIDGCNTSGHPAGDMFHACYPITELETRIHAYDIVISALPATDSTYHLLNHNLLSKLPSHAIVINISRGSIIETDALLQCLESGRLRGAALDVFEQEPIPADSPLWNCDRLLLTPHNSYLSEFYQTRNLKEAYDNLILYAEGGTPRHPVDFKKGY